MDPCQSFNCVWTHTNKQTTHINKCETNKNKQMNGTLMPTNIDATDLILSVHQLHPWQWNASQSREEQKRKEEIGVDAWDKLQWSQSQSQSHGKPSTWAQRSFDSILSSFVFILIAVLFGVLNGCKLLWNVAFYRDLSLNQFGENCVFSACACEHPWCSIVYWTYTKPIIALGLVGHLTKKNYKSFFK